MFFRGIVKSLGIIRALFAGRTFVASINTSGSDSLSLLLDNPSDSGVEALVYYGRVNYEKDTTVTIWEEVSSVSGGSSVPLNNNRVGAGNDSSLSATSNPTFTGDTEHQETELISGGVSQELFDGYKMSIPPGEHIVIELAGGSNGKMAARLGIAELEV